MLPANLRILLCKDPVDMRRSFDGLTAIAMSVLAEDPKSGALFVFLNKRKNQLKALWWDKNGYCILSKRLQRSIFVIPSKMNDSACDAASIRVDGAALATLIAGRDRSIESRVDHNLN